MNINNSMMQLLLALILIANSYSFAEVDWSKRLDDTIIATRLNKDHGLTYCDNISGHEECVLPYVAKYIDDKDDNVINVLLKIIRHVHSDQAFTLLARMVGKGIWTTSYYIYKDYYEDKYLNNTLLKDNLIVGLKNTTYDACNILLLSHYKSDNQVLLLLKRHKKEYTLKVKPLDSRLEVPFTVCIDLALSELKDKDAKASVLHYIANGDIAELSFIINNLKIVSDKDILLAVVTLLKDKRIVRRGSPHIDPIDGRQNDFIILYYRMCDLTLQALENKFDIDLGFPWKEKINYSDEELNVAMGKFLTYINTGASSPSIPHPLIHHIH